MTHFTASQTTQALSSFLPVTPSHRNPAPPPPPRLVQPATPLAHSIPDPPAHITPEPPSPGPPKPVAPLADVCCVQRLHTRDLHGYQQCVIPLRW
jgi:hypothetical protein